MPQVRVEVLGPLRAVADGAEARIGGRRERAVLAVLAAARGRAVTPERLVDEIWGEDAPPSAPGSLQVAVSRLRTALRSIRSAIDSGDPAKVKDALRNTISLVDKLAAKKVIHRNAAARYKSRLASRVAKRASA